MEANSLTRAESLNEIDQAVNFNIPVSPDHVFFTDFSDVRGDFEEKELYKALNVSKGPCYDSQLHQSNKSLVFLGGMRGSGKTTELRKIASKLHGPKCFFVVTCDVDQELNISNIEYVDILIFQLQKLIEKAKEQDLSLPDGVIRKLQGWMAERVQEVEDNTQLSMGIEAGVEARTPTLFTLFNVFTGFKASLMASASRSDTVRLVLKNRFDHFASEVNIFLGEVSFALRENNIAQDVLFIVDGMEKSMTADQRRKVIIEEDNYMRLIKVNAIYTLPIELLKEREQLKMYSTVLSFPFVKLIERNGDRVEKAFERCRDFVAKRVNPALFDSPDTIDMAIVHAGGSPRELLRIIERAVWFADEDAGIITRDAMSKSIRRLANEVAQYIDKKYWDKLYEVAMNNKLGKPTLYDDEVEHLLEYLAVMEYNDGNYKRVNPLVVASEMYMAYLPNELK